MITLGVTGGIGSGKSAFVDRLATHPGVRVLRADDVAKDLMARDPAVRAALVDRFGTEAFAPDGTLNRAFLAARVFANADDLVALNAIVHPAVRRAFEAARDAARADGVRLFVYEAAILFESGADALVDETLVVDAPEAVRIARVVARDGTTPEAVRARMAHQLAPAEARRRADTVVENAGSRAALHAAADTLAQERLRGDGTARTGSAEK